MYRARQFPSHPWLSDAPDGGPSLTIEAAGDAVPPYSNTISLTALLPRKMEMTGDAPSKDRSWKSVYCSLEGTALSIHKDTRSLHKRMRVKSAAASPTKPVSLNVRAMGYAPSYDDLVATYGAAGEKTPASPHLSPGAAPTPVLPSPANHQFLTSPIGLRGSYYSTASTSSYRMSTVSLMYPPASPATLQAPPSPRLPTNMDKYMSSKTLLRQYSLQGARVGLASDYEKRAHVMRLHIQGDQFLLQLPDLQTIVLWIETMQTAIGLSLDLDHRPIPTEDYSSNTYRHSH
ncbi:hypothetical protein BKA62DRAFT_212391 [Auriculariales sp. MPI-PUGE-AT-0066]|nr:hypothetical protein BKA62DRAFT_212391 [Auriculariales sp. MPI-PUGE-AT-0066]